MPSVSPPQLQSLITSAHVQTDETTDVPPEEEHSIKRKQTSFYSTRPRREITY